MDADVVRVEVVKVENRVKLGEESWFEWGIAVGLRPDERVPGA